MSILDFKVHEVALSHPNSKGRIYLSSYFFNYEVENKIDNKKVFLTLGCDYNGLVDLTKAIGTITGIYQKSFDLFVTVRLYDNHPEIQKDKLLMDYNIIPVGTGIVGVDGEISDYKLISFSAIPKD